MPNADFNNQAANTRSGSKPPGFRKSGPRVENAPEKVGFPNPAMPSGSQKDRSAGVSRLKVDTQRKGL